MAFHPFHFFRKRQKTLLAFLTIFVMVIFILSYGKGDAFEWAMAKLGARQGGDKTEVTKLYRSTVTVSDLDRLRRNRQMVNKFAENALVQSALMAERPKFDEADQRRLDQLMSPLFRQMNPAGVRRSLRAFQMDMQKASKTDQARYIGRQLLFEGYIAWRQTNPSGLYFGGNFSAEGLLDFLVWQHQADDLNITLTDEDVRKAVNHEFDSDLLTGDPAADATKVGQLAQRRGGNLQVKDVYDALRDEFRVRLAQEALLGTASGARMAMGTGLAGDEVPAVPTPSEFWEFFRDNRTQLKVTFLKVPVSQFTSEVKDTPTEADLRALFNRYKDVEPSPERKLPGFKEPRRVKVEWVAADPAAAYYRQEAARVMKVLDGARAVADALSGAGSPGGVPAAATPLAIGLAPEPELQAEYEAYVKGVPSWLSPGRMPVPEGNSPYANDVRRPSALASLVGQLAGAGSPWDVLRAAAGFQGETAAHQAEQAVHVASVVLAGTSPSILGAVAQDAAFAHVRVQPLSAVRDALVEQAKEQLAPELARGATETFTKELDAKRFNPKEAAEYVQKNANPEHGVTAHAVMKEARDQAGIVEAPELEPLKRAWGGPLALTPSGARQFAASFFEGNQLYHPAPFRGATAETLYYYWLTESDKAKVLSFEEAKAKVEEAWKFDKARELAKKAADEVAAEAKKKAQEGIGADRYLKDEAARRDLEWFEPTTAVARLIPVPDAHAFMGGPTQYRAYQFEDSKITYPRLDTVEVLLKDLTKPGDAAVIEDRPDRNFYVAVLRERTVPTEKEFFETYEKAPRGALLGDSLWARFQGEREDKYRTALVRQFRVEAGAPLDDQGNYNLDPEVRKRFSGRGGSEE